MTRGLGRAIWVCDVRLFAKINPALCDQCNQSVKACSSYASREKTIILNMLPAESECSFSDVEESDGIDMESSSEKDFGRLMT